MSIREVKMFGTDDGEVFDTKENAIYHDTLIKGIEAYEMTEFAEYMAFSEFTTALEIDFEYMEKILKELKENLDKLD